MSVGIESDLRRPTAYSLRSGAVELGERRGAARSGGNRRRHPPVDSAPISGADELQPPVDGAATTGGNGDVVWSAPSRRWSGKSDDQKC